MTNFWEGITQAIINTLRWQWMNKYRDTRIITLVVCSNWHPIKSTFSTRRRTLRCSFWGKIALQCSTSRSQIILEVPPSTSRFISSEETAQVSRKWPTWISLRQWSEKWSKSWSSSPKKENQEKRTWPNYSNSLTIKTRRFKMKELPISRRKMISSPSGKKIQSNIRNSMTICIRKSKPQRLTWQNTKRDAKPWANRRRTWPSESNRLRKEVPFSSTTT